MHPPLTYELRVTFDPQARESIKTKQKLIDWLLLSGVESFVEGALDVDYNHEYGEPEPDFWEKFGGELAPLSIYRYSKESLDDLSVRLTREFASRVEKIEMHTMPTETWMEGWKESFKPFATDTFYVRPPWEKEPAPAGLLTITIEPGMAFGTGQHATTRLCLDQLGAIYKARGGKVAGLNVLDVGTGTGILAIGAKLLGFGPTLGTDIDDDAILAAAENVRLNDAKLEFRKGSIPAAGEGAPADLVFANILAVVLLRIMDQLAAATKPGGHLVLSGLLVAEEEELIECGKAVGLRCMARGRQEDWACLVMTK